MHSLPGGHVANITACSASLAWRYSMGAFEPAIWGLVGGVALGRTLDRAHWASDEILGFGFGIAVGREVALRSLHRSDQSAQPNPEHGAIEGFTAVTTTSARITMRRRF